VIHSIRIESLRGIRAGALDGLGRIAILVGPNGCGKSTVLDAMLIAASPSPGDAVGRVVSRCAELRNGARWLFWRGGKEEQPRATIDIASEDGRQRSATLRILPDVSPSLEEKLTQARWRGPYREIQTVITHDGDELEARTAFSFENDYRFEQTGVASLRQGPQIKLIEPRPGGLHASLSRVYSEAVEDGRFAESLELAKAVVPGLTGILNLTDEGGSSVVHLVFADYSVPLARAGDGIQALLRLCFELSLRPGGTALIEEPEVHQHPRALFQSARALVAAAQRGIQVILTTHSLELVDLLRSELDDDRRDWLSVHNLAKVDGELRAVRYSGAEVALARESIGEDLR